jgi:hypothetical protein
MILICSTESKQSMVPTQSHIQSVSEVNRTEREARHSFQVPRLKTRDDKPIPQRPDTSLWYGT